MESKNIKVKVSIKNKEVLQRRIEVLCALMRCCDDKRGVNTFADINNIIDSSPVLRGKITAKEFLEEVMELSQMMVKQSRTVLVSAIWIIALHEPLDAPGIEYCIPEYEIEDLTESLKRCLSIGLDF